MSGVTITIDDRSVLAAFERLAAAGANPVPALKTIGEDMRASTIARFRSERDPTGRAWAPLSPEWRARKARLKRATGILKSTGQLSREIVAQLAGDMVAIGTNRPHARVHQFGLEAAGRPTIPARPFLGISADDQRDIVDTISDLLADIVAGGA